MPVRKIPKNYRSITGRFPSVINGRCISYESGIERNAFLILEFTPGVVAYEEQPVKLIGKKGNKELVYTPDCLVTYANGKPKQLLEVKYLSELKEKAAEFEPKFELARTYAHEHGMEFIVLNDEEIKKAPLDNYKLLYRFTRPPNKLMSYKNQVLSIVVEENTITVGDLLFRLSPVRTDQAEFIPIIWHLVFNKVLITNINEPLGYKSLLRVSNGENGII